MRRWQSRDVSCFPNLCPWPAGCRTFRIRRLTFPEDWDLKTHIPSRCFIFLWIVPQCLRRICKSSPKSSPIYKFISSLISCSTNGPQLSVSHWLIVHVLFIRGSVIGRDTSPLRCRLRTSSTAPDYPCSGSQQWLFVDQALDRDMLPARSW